MKCPICKKVTKRVNVQPEIYICKQCKHSFSFIPKIKQEEYNEKYFTIKHKNWFSNPDYSLFNKFYKEIRRKKKENISLLDVGCGNGNFLRFLKNRDKNINLTGIDFYENKDNNISYLKGNFLD